MQLINKKFLTLLRLLLLVGPQQTKLKKYNKYKQYKLPHELCNVHPHTSAIHHMRPPKSFYYFKRILQTTIQHLSIPSVL